MFLVRMDIRFVILVFRSQLGAYPAMEDIALTDKKLGFLVKGTLNVHPLSLRLSVHSLGEIKPEDLYRKISKYRALLAPLRFGAVCLRDCGDWILRVRSSS